MTRRPPLRLTRPGQVMGTASYISPELRRLVAARAEGLCEYCLIHEDDTFFGCEVDHILSEKAWREENQMLLDFFDRTLAR